MSQYDLMLYLKIKLWPVFHGSVILPYILKAILMYKHDTLGLISK